MKKKIRVTKAQSKATVNKWKLAYLVVLALNLIYVLLFYFMMQAYK